MTRASENGLARRLRGKHVLVCVGAGHERLLVVVRVLPVQAGERIPVRAVEAAGRTGIRHRRTQMLRRRTPSGREQDRPMGSLDRDRSTT